MRSKNKKLLFIVFLCFASFAGLVAYAMQSGASTDVTSSATITPTTDGFRVDFQSPVAITEMEYNGNFVGPIEVQDGGLGNPVHIDEALSLIDKAIELKPEEPAFLDTKGLILMYAGRHQDAIPFMEKAVELSCEGPLYVMHLAYAQMKNGDSPTASSTFEKVRPQLMARRELLSEENKTFLDELDVKLGPSL
ncbi:MAG: tetratricopeptide repeat protein [Thermoguttaceae bacterium]